MAHQQWNFFETEMNRQSFHIMVGQFTNVYRKYNILKRKKKKFWFLWDEAKCL